MHVKSNDIFGYIFSQFYRISAKLLVHTPIYAYTHMHTHTHTHTVG